MWRFRPRRPWALAWRYYRWRIEMYTGVPAEDPARRGDHTPGRATASTASTRRHRARSTRAATASEEGAKAVVCQPTTDRPGEPL